jgi:hypothetical protein
MLLFLQQFDEDWLLPKRGVFMGLSSVPEGGSEPEQVGEGDEGGEATDEALTTDDVQTAHDTAVKSLIKYGSNLVDAYQKDTALKAVKGGDYVFDDNTVSVAMKVLQNAELDLNMASLEYEGKLETLGTISQTHIKKVVTELNKTVDQTISHLNEDEGLNIDQKIDDVDQAATTQEAEIDQKFEGLKSAVDNVSADSEHITSEVKTSLTEILDAAINASNSKNLDPVQVLYDAYATVMADPDKAPFRDDVAAIMPMYARSLQPDGTFPDLPSFTEPATEESSETVLTSESMRRKYEGAVFVSIEGNAEPTVFYDSAAPDFAPTTMSEEARAFYEANKDDIDVLSVPAGISLKGRQNEFVERNSLGMGYTPPQATAETTTEQPAADLAPSEPEGEVGEATPAEEGITVEDALEEPAAEAAGSTEDPPLSTEEVSEKKVGKKEEEDAAPAAPAEQTETVDEKTSSQHFEETIQKIQDGEGDFSSLDDAARTQLAQILTTHADQISTNFEDNREVAQDIFLAAQEAGIPADELVALDAELEAVMQASEDFAEIHADHVGLEVDANEGVIESDDVALTEDLEGLGFDEDSPDQNVRSFQQEYGLRVQRGGEWVTEGEAGAKTIQMIHLQSELQTLEDQFSEEDILINEELDEENVTPDGDPKLEAALQKLGYADASDASIRSFQDNYGLQVDGAAGPYTKGIINDLLTLNVLREKAAEAAEEKPESPEVKEVEEGVLTTPPETDNLNPACEITQHGVTVNYGENVRNVLNNYNFPGGELGFRETQTHKGDATYLDGPSTDALEGARFYPFENGAQKFNQNLGRDAQNVLSTLDLSKFASIELTKIDDNTIQIVRRKNKDGPGIKNFITFPEQPEAEAEGGDSDPGEIESMPGNGDADSMQGPDHQDGPPENEAEAAEAADEAEEKSERVKRNIENVGTDKEALRAYYQENYPGVVVGEIKFADEFPVEKGDANPGKGESAYLVTFNIMIGDQARSIRAVGIGRNGKKALKEGLKKSEEVVMDLHQEFLTEPFLGNGENPKKNPSRAALEAGLADWKNGRHKEGFPGEDYESFLDELNGNAMNILGINNLEITGPKGARDGEGIRDEVTLTLSVTGADGKSHTLEAKGLSGDANKSLARAFNNLSKEVRKFPAEDFDFSEGSAGAEVRDQREADLARFEGGDYDKGSALETEGRTFNRDEQLQDKIDAIAQEEPLATILEAGNEASINAVLKQKSKESVTAYPENPSLTYYQYEGGEITAHEISFTDGIINVYPEPDGFDGKQVVIGLDTDLGGIDVLGGVYIAEGPQERASGLPEEHDSALKGGAGDLWVHENDHHVNPVYSAERDNPQITIGMTPDHALGLAATLIQGETPSYNDGALAVAMTGSIPRIRVEANTVADPEKKEAPAEAEEAPRATPKKAAESGGEAEEQK